jgi:plastocyanin
MISQKNVALILMTIGTVLAGPEVVSHVNKDVSSQSAEIMAPHEAEVGELVRFYYPAGTITWDIPVNDYTLSNDNRTLHLSFRKAGVYEIVAAATVGTRVEIRRHTITVGTPEPEVPPTPPAPPEPETHPMVAKVYDWCKDNDAPANIGTLADNFEQAATEASDIDSLLKMTADLNRSSDLKGCSRVMALIQQSLFDNMQTEDFDAHVECWNAIAEGIRNYLDEK